MADFASALALTLKHEGGFVDDKDDLGGATNLGITKATYEAWVGVPVTVEDMRALTVDMVTPIYKKRYWDVLSLDDCQDQRYAESLFDYCVNAGPGAAHKANDAARGDLRALLAAKMEHYEAIVAHRPASEKFLAGWTKRAEEYSA